VIEQQYLEAGLKAALEPAGFPHSPTHSGLEGWKVFLFQGLGEAGLMWSRPNDHADAEAGKGRDLDDQHLRTERLAAMQAVLQARGYTSELGFLGDTPSITITRVPA
jgi:hypothetical protein